MNVDSYYTFNFPSEYLRFLTFPFICFSLVITLNLLRRKFPITVNCWFCNQNTALPYKERNSFTCPSCHQYNGFTETGDYNKVIPEQQDELLNHIVSPRKLHSARASNGLCQICNNNQQLKIYQLANFVPLNEDNYDVEIEHFQTQLEKAYKLCQSCNATVKNTISKRNCALLGKQIEEIRKSGKTLLNQSTTAKQNISNLKKGILCSIVISTVYYVTKNRKEWIVFTQMIEKYSLELMSALIGSLITMLVMRVTSPRVESAPLLTVKKIKIEKTTPGSRISTGSYTTSPQHNDMSGADISYTSFHSPLNSTTKSDDGGSICSELERISADTNSSDSCKTILRKSPSAPSMYSSFTTTQSPFPSKPPLNHTFQQLNINLNAQSSSNRVILSPAKFRNPWTGKPWDTEINSRSSSQSSGVYSRATSICGDDITSDQNLFKNVTNPLPTHIYPNNNFNTIDSMNVFGRIY